MNFSLPNVKNGNVHNVIPRIKRKLPWGFEGYKTPVTITSISLKGSGGKFNKAKNLSFIDEITKEKEKLPSSLKYNKLLDWTNLIKGNKGRFMKSPKKTFTEDFSSKKASLPSPDLYDPNPIKANLSTHK